MGHRSRLETYTPIINTQPNDPRWDGLPSQEGLPRIFSRVQTAATEQHVRLGDAGYKYDDSDSNGLRRYEIATSAHCKYVDFRRFMRQILYVYPTMQVELAKIERNKVGDDEVEVTFKLVLFVGRSAANSK